MGISVVRHNTDDYFTYALRPKYADSVTLFSSSQNIQSKETAILIQGKAVEQDDFTLETVRLYKKYFPESKIIVSTWLDTDKKIIKGFKKAGASVCLSEYPRIAGHGHINYQRNSTVAGIKKAKESGCRYIMKTRTDQRLYSPDIIRLCLKLLEMFPVVIETKAKKRLVAWSAGTYSNRLYNISDMFMFGTAEDIEKYYQPPMDTRDGTDTLPPDRYPDLTEYSMERPGEIYFTSHYIAQQGHQLLWTKADSDFYRNTLFIVIDSQMADLYWPKYTSQEFRWKKYRNNNDTELRMVSFAEWLTSQ